MKKSFIIACSLVAITGAAVSAQDNGQRSPNAASDAQATDQANSQNPADKYKHKGEKDNKDNKEKVKKGDQKDAQPGTSESADHK